MWLSGKESACNAGDLGSIPELGRSPGERNGNPLQSLVGYGPWGCKESDMTEPLSTHTHTHTHTHTEIIVSFNEHLQSARSCAKPFIYILSFNPI